MPLSRKKQARSNYGKGSDRVAGIPGENSGPFFSSSAGERETAVAGAIVHAGDSSDAFSRGWMAAYSLVRSLGFHLVRLA